MSHRMRKIVGYGLTDVATTRHQITDPRLNTTSPFLTFDIRPAPDAAAFVRFLEERQNAGGARTGIERAAIRDGAAGPRSHRYQPERSIVHRTEDGALPNVLCIKPVSAPDWARSEDTIDAITEGYILGSGMEPWVKVLDTNPYPWSGLFMDDRTGEQSPHAIVWWVREKHEWDKSRYEDTSVLDDLATEGGFADHTDALAHCVPWVPNEIRLLCEFADLFTDPAVVNQLRPMLYTYWS